MKIGLEKKLKEFFWWCSEITEHTHILKDRLGIFLAKCRPEIWKHKKNYYVDIVKIVN